MSDKKKIEHDDEEQSRRFVETAKELGADESGEAFERALSSISPAQPEASRSRPSEKQSSA